ncbi:MAG: tyrosine-type recombinase/integrase [Rhodospirillales bacterium]|nr:tyrosine-type recombinase/integrase [Rhodospirillales bacterium]
MGFDNVTQDRLGHRPHSIRLSDRIQNAGSMPIVDDEPGRISSVNHEWERLRGAYADNTIRAYKTDFEIFSLWCEAAGLSPLPTTADTISAFIASEMENSKPATICRRICAISRIHRLCDLADPTASETVRLALRRMHRAKGRRQKQALGLTADLRDKLIAATTGDLKGLRDRTLVSLAYDTLRRRSELVALQIDDLDPVPQGGAVILVRRSKTDQEGKGNLAYVSPKTLDFCLDWITQANIEGGPILRSIGRFGSVGTSLYPGSVGTVYKRLAKAAGLPEDTVKRLSGHSARVGAAQDMAAAGIDILAIMQAGGWKSPEIVARYVENLDVLRGGGYRLAMQQSQKAPICEP